MDVATIRSKQSPAIHQAIRATDGSGVVVKGPRVDEATAIKIRMAGGDIVVCGGDLVANRQVAMQLEQAVGPWLRQLPHRQSAGSNALPHFQQRNPPPDGHTFYETATTKARNQP